MAGADFAAMPSQGSAQLAPQPLVGGTEGPPSVDAGSVTPYIAGAPASSFMHEVIHAIPSHTVALLLAFTCTTILQLYQIASLKAVITS